VRNERSSWNGMERKWKSYTASKWTNNHMFFIFCTTVGWWGNLEALGQRSGAKR